MSVPIFIDMPEQSQNYDSRFSSSRIKAYPATLASTAMRNCPIRKRMNIFETVYIL